MYHFILVFDIIETLSHTVVQPIKVDSTGGVLRNVCNIHWTQNIPKVLFPTSIEMLNANYKASGHVHFFFSISFSG